MKLRDDFVAMLEQQERDERRGRFATAVGRLLGRLLFIAVCGWVTQICLHALAPFWAPLVGVTYWQALALTWLAGSFRRKAEDAAP